MTFEIEPNIMLTIIAVVVSAASGTAAVVVSYLAHRRSEKSEQLRTSREIWSGILNHNRTIHEWEFDRDINSDESRKRLKRSLYLLKNDLDHFVFLVETDEIKERSILKYYQLGRLI